MRKYNMVNLKFVRDKMKDKPTMYMMYGQFLNGRECLTKNQLKEARKIINTEIKKLLSKIDVSIKKEKA